MPHKRRPRPPGAELGGVGAFAVSELPIVLCFCQPRGHNLHGIFADADAIARRKVRWRASVLGGECSRDDVAGIPIGDAVPHKRRARPPGADIGGVSAFVQSLNFQSSSLLDQENPFVVVMAWSPCGSYDGYRRRRAIRALPRFISHYIGK